MARKVGRSGIHLDARIVICKSIDDFVLREIRTVMNISFDARPTFARLLRTLPRNLNKLRETYVAGRNDEISFFNR